jgi:1-acyl-sn-glycerol-3-phosphate acyltransferase
LIYFISIHISAHSFSFRLPLFPLLPPPQTQQTNLYIYIGKGEHVLIDRTDKRSQLRTFKQAITYLKKGIPIMAFPEGKRSPDGRLMEFKGGIFSMAVKAKVPIVPLSIANAHAVMPSVGFLPVQSGRRGELRVFVHDPIDVEGKSEDEISREVREALLRELPADQHPLGE